jgi:diguanylate cyclase (GGDEF)-like protein
LDRNGDNVDVLAKAAAADGSASYFDVVSGRVPMVAFAQYKRHGSPVSLWLRFSISAAPEQNRSEWLIVLPRWTESAELYRAGDAPLRTSMYVPFALRPVDLDVPAFRVRDADFGGPPLYLRMAYYPDTDLTVFLETRDAFSRAIEPAVAIVGMLFGTLLAVGLLNVFVFATTRDENAYWYVLYIASLIFGELATSAIGDRYLWATLGVSTRILTYAAQQLAGFAFYAFARTFLRTKTETPVYDRVMVGYLWFGVALQSIEALAPGGSALEPYVLIAQLGALLLPGYVGVARLRAGYTPARYFVMSFIPVAAGFAASLTYQILEPPLSGVWFWAYNGGELGIMLQAVVLSFSVADRIRMLERAMRLTQRRLSEVSKVAKSMESLAHVDTLTGLANRVRFVKSLNDCLERQPKEEELAVLFCDLDGFKAVNDGFGHHAGDELLRIVAQRLAGSLRANDLVARWGGDEFAVLLVGTPGEQALHIAKTLESALDEPIVVDGTTMPIGLSVGIAAFPGDARTTESLLMIADKRMYEAKQHRKVSS